MSKNLDFVLANTTIATVIDKWYQSSSIGLDRWAPACSWCEEHIGHGGAWGSHIFDQVKWIGIVRYDDCQFIFEHQEDHVRFMLTWG